MKRPTRALIRIPIGLASNSFILVRSPPIASSMPFIAPLIPLEAFSDLAVASATAFVLASCLSRSLFSLLVCFCMFSDSLRAFKRSFCNLASTFATSFSEPPSFLTLATSFSTAEMVFLLRSFCILLCLFFASSRSSSVFVESLAFAFSFTIEAWAWSVSNVTFVTISLFVVAMLLYIV